ncbi:MFS transporter [Methanobrevibacter sp.]|jgi:predicted MFS family arabinose efflux permease|uniref:MFS transporter n=1 Tax=Methanobrevibacter sp. TaxID=66852 RepID=UPI002E76D10C|nr:MFS transporter [Methanobrevibacter sp.]MBR3338201.1 MFS transporter [Bacillus sp. (in: firmicutes)]MEE1336975.1 MFS transporter [Methanobrevibacter sp.]
MNDNEIVMTKFLAILFAICSGLAIGNLYWAQPLLVQIMDGFGLPAANGGLLVTATQIGYAMGILFILPLGDFVRRKRMIAIVMVLSVLALVSCAISPSFIILSLSLFSMGIVTISGQIILPLAGDLSREDERGHIVGIVSSGITTGILFSRFASGIIAGFWGWRSVYVIAAALNLVMVLVMIYVLPEIPAKNKFKSYGKLLASVFTTFKNHRSLPNILLHSGLIFGLIFNIFWTSLTFLLSADPFNYNTFQIGLVSLAGLAAAVFGVGIGKLQDKGLSIPALGAFIVVCLVSMVCGFAFSDSIVAIVIVAAVLSVAVQGVSVLTQTRLFNLSQGERSRLNTVFVVNNFIFGAVGSALASLLWSLGGWSYVMMAASAVSVAALIVWLFSRSKFKYADESLDN